MGGIGSFNQDSKTLYLNGLKNVLGQDMQEVVIKHFKEWGEMEYCMG